MAEEKSRLSKFFHRRSGEEERRASFEESAVKQDVGTTASSHAATLAVPPPPFEASSSTSDSVLGISEKGEAQPPTYAPARTRFASLSLHSYDCLRLLEFPNEIVDKIRVCLETHYEFGVQKENSDYGGSHEFKLSSYPWSGQGKDAITSRIIIREILATLWNEGWILLSGVDVSRKEADADTLIFRHEPLTPTSPPRRQLDWLSMSFNEYDKFRLISSDAPVLNSLISPIGALLKSIDLYSREEWKDQERGAYQFKCKKYVWDASGENTMRSRSLLLGLLGVLEEQGWALYVSVDQSSTGGNVGSNDTWYLVREKNWVPGMKVWHR